MTSTLRVLHVLNTLRRSGAEVMLQCAAPLWAEHGVDCEIVAVGDEPGPFAPDLAEAGYPIHWLANPGNRHLLPQFSRLVRDGRFDVVHLHVERANFWLAMAAKAAGGSGLVQSLHGQFSFHGALRAERALQRATLRRIGARFVAVAPGVAATEWHRFRHRPIVIWNWCDTARFAPADETQRTIARQRFGIDRATFVITSVGNCWAVKNHASLIEAVSLLQARRDNLLYLHAGDDSYGVGPDEHRLAAELGVGDKVRFLGQVTGVEALLHATDLFVMPSLHDGLPVAAIEAMAAGVPVLLADSAGLRDIAAAGLGSLADPTPSGLAQQIDLLLVEPHKLERSRATATSDVVRTLFGPQQGVAAYAEVYKAVAPQRDVASLEHVMRRAAPVPAIGVLVASHNRRDSTLACLRSLAGQVDSRAKIEVYLVDDASGDGTADAVRQEFPMAQVVDGSGQLFWAGAMHVVEQRALVDSPDFLLWLNDDVVLEPDAVARLLATHDELMISGAAPAIVAGATKDGGTGRTSYGGVRRDSRLRRMHFSLAEPGDRPQLCTTMNGNVVLIPTSIVKQVGGIDPRYRHGMADFDYGLRVTKAGIPVWLTSGWVGTCAQNPVEGSFKDPSLLVQQRVRALVSPKGIPPREWLRLTRKHGGIAWPAMYISPYVRFGVNVVRHRLGTHESVLHDSLGRADR